MNIRSILSACVLLALGIACKPDQTRIDGDHGDRLVSSDSETHDHPAASLHVHDEENHVAKVPGPNGGRLITDLTPHLEFWIRGDRYMEIRFFQEDLTLIPASNQVVSLIGGDRLDPFRISFIKESDHLVSESGLPEGNDWPVVLQIRETTDADLVFAKFHANLLICPECQYGEYACICAHDEHHEDDHVHE